ncbi:MAG TPA: hypothetical protein PLH57_06045, partial [Oligoflexia bacterium]|nr:hypothetical protein [Oligoflexia bacterium]
AKKYERFKRKFKHYTEDFRITRDPQAADRLTSLHFATSKFHSETIHLLLSLAKKTVAANEFGEVALSQFFDFVAKNEARASDDALLIGSEITRPLYLHIIDRVEELGPEGLQTIAETLFHTQRALSTIASADSERSAKILLLRDTVRPLLEHWDQAGEAEFDKRSYYFNRLELLADADCNSIMAN